MTFRAAIRRTKQLFHHFHHTMASATLSPAPWRSTFLSHAQDMDEPSFVLSTLHPIDSSSTLSNITSFTPRARTVIFRGMWANLPVNPKNPADLNPGIYETDLPTITTDARMEKVPELFRSAKSAAGGATDPDSSGSGGPIEAVFWMPKVKTQWRMRGHAYIIGPDIDTSAAASVRDALGRYMRSSSSGNKADKSWSWSRELTAQFGNLSPGMRGTFRNPPPGTPLSQEPEEGLGRGQKVEDVEDKIARKNFRVLVIVPEEVEQVDLNEPAKAQRWSYKHAEDGSWKTTELWP